MDNQIEHHLPLITSRIVFAPRIFLSPPTVTNRMEFPSIYIETRDDSPVPEQRRAHNRASTPKAKHHARTPGKLASTLKTSAIARPVQRINTAVVFANDMDLDNLSPLTEAEDEPEEEDEDMLDEREVEYTSSNDGVEEGLIPKPKGEAGRP
jgi:hypothetical protein